MKFPVLWSGLGCEMLGDISSHRAILQSEGKQSIHSLTQILFHGRDASKVALYTILRSMARKGMSDRYLCHGMKQ